MGYKTKVLHRAATAALILILSINCGPASENMSFRERIAPVDENSGLKMDGYFVWGGSVIKVDGVYHLFASRWPAHTKFPAGYRTDSEIVRATSETLTGPYTFREVVIGERDSTYWDSNMAHNPTIHKVADTYVLYYIGSDFTTYQQDDPHLLRRVGYATAKSIDGPWHRSDRPVIDAESNNPSALFEEDGSVKLIFRDTELNIFCATAPSFEGPYTIGQESIWTECRLEDFYTFKRGGLYHMICEDNVGAVSGHERWGVHLVSDNGVDGWRRHNHIVAYDHDIEFTGGKILHCVRRERPQLYIEEGKVCALITSVYDGAKTWCQPVELSPPY